MVKGLRAEMMYFKKTLDKIGVSVDVEHAGKYKDFGDMFTRSDMSPETREVMTSVVDDLYGNLVTRIAAGRRKTPEQVRAIIDQGPFTATGAEGGAGRRAALRRPDVGRSEGRIGAAPQGLDWSDTRRSRRNRWDLPARVTSPCVVAEGDIVRGDPGDDGADEQPDLVRLQQTAARVGNDSQVKGVVVRIDSPAASRAASDEIWRQMNLLSKKKPMVISMSDAAASGGYYMAMTGDPIVAYPAPSRVRSAWSSASRTCTACTTSWASPRT